MTIVSLSVRYASASVEEFIENHAPDVSARGIYIKTERDIPLGTLIDFDVRIAGNQTVLAGAGRVMWARTTAQATPERPAGIGVRFIELEEASTAVIERLLGQRSDAGQKYMEETEMATSRVQTPPPSGTVIERSAPSLPPAPPPRRSSSRPGPSRAARRSLPPVAPPPRRSTVPPRPSIPPPDAHSDDSDSTQLGPLPPMPKGRKATLVGLGAPILPRVTTPPRRRSSKPPPAPTPGTTPPPPKATPPPPKTASLPPKPTPPPPKVAPAPPRPGPSIPPPRPKVASVDLDDAPDDETLMQPMSAFEREMTAPAPPKPATDVAPAPDEVPLPIDVELDIPDAEPTVIVPQDDAEPTVIVPRESPLPPAPVAPVPPLAGVAATAAHAEPENTAPQSMKELLGADAEPQRDLGDTQRTRRRGRKRRLAILGAVLVATGSVGVVLALTRRPTPREPPLAASSTVLAAPPPTEPPATAAVDVPPVEAGPEASPTEEASTEAETPSTTPEASAPPATPSQAAPSPAAPNPVAIEFSALPIERAPRPPPKQLHPPEPASTTASASAPTATSITTPTPTTPPPRPKPSAAPAAPSNCNPTYTIDADGNKHFKPECF